MPSLQLGKIYLDGALRQAAINPKRAPVARSYRRSLWIGARISSGLPYAGLLYTSLLYWGVALQSLGEIL